MEKWISVIATTGVALLVLTMIVLALAKLWRDKKNGKMSCCGDCSNCTGGCGLPGQTSSFGDKTAGSRKLQLLFTFLKIGTFTFGGGYAMIPLIQKEVTGRHQWISEEELLDIIAIAESTPGPIAINAATFIGYRTAGFFGALFATIGVVLPSFLIIIGVSLVLRQFRDFQPVKYAFVGIRAGVLALIVNALLNMYKKCPKTWISYVISVFAFVAVVIFKVKVLAVLVACGVLGYLGTLLMAKGGSR